MPTTIAKKFASATGTCSYRRPQASPSGIPMACVSTMPRNSLLRGSGASLVIIRMLSRSGRPALTPRTMTSTASGKPARNFASRRFLRNLSSQRGSPHPAAKANPIAGSNPTLSMKPRANATMPSSALMMKNLFFDHLRPAYGQRRRFGAAVFHLFERRLNLLAARLLQVAHRTLGDRRAGSHHAIPSLLGLLLARQGGIEEDPSEPADRGRDQEEKRYALHVCSSASGPRRRIGGFRRVEGGRQPFLLAVIARTLPESRSADAGRVMSPHQVAVLVLAHKVVHKKVLCNDDIAFHADDFGDVGDAPGAIAQTRGLHDDVDRSAQHLAYRARGEGIASHRDHGFNARERLARAVGVQRTHGAVMAGVHGLQQVEGLRSTHLADDDSFRAHAQAVAHQVAHGDLALALEIR